MLTIKTHRYGLFHVDGTYRVNNDWTVEGLWLLVQGNSKPVNALGGPINNAPRFQVRLRTGDEHCNHLIPVSVPVVTDRVWQEFERHLAEDSLVNLMLPLPKQKNTPDLLFVEDEEDAEAEYLVTLLRSSSPLELSYCYASVEDLVRLGVERTLAELTRTNLQPLVATGAKPAHAPFLRSLVEAGAANAERRLVIAGDPDLDVTGFTRHRRPLPADERMGLIRMIAMPWESLGATAVRLFMRGEWTGHPGMSPKSKPRTAQ